jgi:2-iminobutanoate/2-iminopropanoate deaminase
MLMSNERERTSLQGRRINASETPAPLSGSYSQAFEVVGVRRVLYTSGQTPVGLDGIAPSTFAEQARLAWRNVVAQLAAADMSVENLVKVTTILSDRALIAENRQIRQEVLGNHAPALTVFFADLFEPGWMVEIEAVAYA